MIINSKRMDNCQGFWEGGGGAFELESFNRDLGPHNFKYQS